MELYFQCGLIGLGEMCLAFLTMTISIAMGINPRAPGWNISGIVSEEYQK